MKVLFEYWEVMNPHLKAMLSTVFSRHLVTETNASLYPLPSNAFGPPPGRGMHYQPRSIPPLKSLRIKVTSCRELSAGSPSQLWIQYATLISARCIPKFGQPSHQAHAILLAPNAQALQLCRPLIESLTAPCNVSLLARLESVLESRNLSHEHNQFFKMALNLSPDFGIPFFF